MELPDAEGCVSDDGINPELQQRDEDLTEFLNIIKVCTDEPDTIGNGLENAEINYEFDDETDIELSEHQQCSVHTINLIPASDIKKFLRTNALLSTINSKTMVKMSKLWNAGGRPLSSERIKQIFGCAIKRPCVTRWNSLFDCLEQILSLGWIKIDETFEMLEIPKLKRREKTYLEEKKIC